MERECKGLIKRKGLTRKRDEQITRKVASGKRKTRKRTFKKENKKTIKEKTSEKKEEEEEEANVRIISGHGHCIVDPWKTLRSEFGGAMSKEELSLTQHLE